MTEFQAKSLPEFPPEIIDRSEALPPGMRADPNKQPDSWRRVTFKGQRAWVHTEIDVIGCSPLAPEHHIHADTCKLNHDTCLSGPSLGFVMANDDAGYSGVFVNGRRIAGLDEIVDGWEDDQR